MDQETMNPYLILVLTICLLYYLLFKYKHDRKWKTLALVATIGGMTASIGGILEEYFVSSKLLIKDIFAVPVFVAIVVFFYLAISMAWRVRKDPEKKIMIYTSFGMLVFFVIFVMVVFILAQLGFYG